MTQRKDADALLTENGNINSSPVQQRGRAPTTKGGEMHTLQRRCCDDNAKWRAHLRSNLGHNHRSM